MESSILQAVPLTLLLLRQIMEFVTLERARTGKTAKEIFTDAGVQIDANEVALLADLEKYNAG